MSKRVKSVIAIVSILLIFVVLGLIIRSSQIHSSDTDSVTDSLSGKQSTAAVDNTTVVYEWESDTANSDATWYSVECDLDEDSTDMYFVFTYTGDDFNPTDLTLYYPDNLTTQAPTFKSNEAFLGGEHSILFELNDAPAGTYHCVLNSNDTIPYIYYTTIISKSWYEKIQKEYNNEHETEGVYIEDIEN